MGSLFSKDDSKNQDEGGASSALEIEATIANNGNNNGQGGGGGGVIGAFGCFNGGQDVRKLEEEKDVEPNTIQAATNNFFSSVRGVFSGSEEIQLPKDIDEAKIVENVKSNVIKLNGQVEEAVGDLFFLGSDEKPPTRRPKRQKPEAQAQPAGPPKNKADGLIVDIDDDEEEENNNKNNKENDKDEDGAKSKGKILSVFSRKGKEGETSTLKLSPRKMMCASEYGKIKQLPLVNRLRVDLIFDEPKDSLIKSVTTQMTKHGVPFNVAKVVACTAHGSKWPRAMQYSRFLDECFGTAMRKDLSCTAADAVDSIVDALLQRVHGRLIGSVKETLYNANTCRYDVILAYAPDNPRVKALQGDQKEMVILIRQGKGRPNFEYVNGPPEEKVKRTFSFFGSKKGNKGTKSNDTEEGAAIERTPTTILVAPTLEKKSSLPPMQSPNMSPIAAK